MSDQPTSLPSLPSSPGPAIASGSAAGPSWSQRLGSVLVIIICLELGLFLLIYPWTDGWSDNYFAYAVPGGIRATWHAFWNNSFVRGGVSGVGAVNLWIAVTEVFRLFARGSANRSASNRS
jgi:hypothetical protein